MSEYAYHNKNEEEAAAREWIKTCPKTELHLHIEGSLEPELMFKLAKRNNINLRYKSIDEVKKAYNFNNLQSFLDLYYAGCAVLINEVDFYDLCFTYLTRAHNEGVLYCELFFDPQTHMDRGVPFETVISGLKRAMNDATSKFGIKSQLIMCFLRHLSEEAAMDTLTQALPHKNDILGVGLDSGEANNPPLKFNNVFKKASENGFRLVCHCAEEGPPQYILDALQMGVERVDHGVRALEDDACVSILKQKQIPLTVCPLSNYRLKVYERYFQGKCCVGTLIQRGLMVTINSDDPSYFGGYTIDNYYCVVKDCNLKPHDVIQLAKNGFLASFLPNEEKHTYISLVDKFATTYPLNTF